MLDSLPNESRPLGKRLLRWARRTAFSLLALIIILACAGATYQVIGNWRDTRRFPQRGRTVRAGPLKMNMDCAGSGSPTVILEQGGGMPALGWMKVQPQVA